MICCMAGEPSVLWTKLAMPSLRERLVSRPRLLDLLERGLNSRLILVAAGVGYGKTTLLSEWSHRHRQQVAWVSIDERDNDLARFLNHLIHSLQAIWSGLGEAVLALMQTPKPPPPPELLTSLVNDLLAANGGQPARSDVILVLDDYHLVDDAGVHQAITFLLEQAPPWFHLCLATRSDPPLPIARLRAREQLTEIREADLRFTFAEVAAFLGQTMGLTLFTDDIAILEERTEGWIAGLQLAALSMRGRSDPSAFVRQFSGEHRHIFDYLTDEVLARQPADVQGFLLDTSILDRLTADLCDAVSGRAGSQAMLERLERENLFVVPLDDERHWYRYHHLFSEQLRHRLQATMPARAPQLHLRASEWYATHARAYEAIGHALAAEHSERVIELIEHEGPTLVMRGEVATLLGWLNALPPAVVQARPRLSLTYAWAHFVTTQIEGIRPHIAAVFRSLDLTPDQVRERSASLSAQERGQVGEALALAALVATYEGEQRGAVRLAEQAFDILPREATAPRIVVSLALGDATRDLDDVAAASQHYAQAIGMSQEIGNTLAAMVMANDLARLQLAQGRLHLAANTYRQVLEWGQNRLQPHYAIGQALVGYGNILREWNRLDQAEGHLLQGIRQCERGGYLRYQIFGQAALARLRLAQHDHEGMLAAAGRARDLALRAGVGRDIAYVEALQARLYLVTPQPQLARALAWVEKAGVATADQPSILHEFAHLTLARVLLMQATHQPSSRRIAEVVALLERLLARAEKSGRIHSVIEILALQSMARHLAGDIPKAMLTIERSLALAEPEGYVRLFVDEGLPMAQVLRHASSRRILPDYVAALLAEFGEHPRSSEVGAPSVAAPLSPRELEVLHLLAAGLSNREIGETLFISPGTVNTHTRKIYEKLEVGNRTQAVARARGLKLLQ